MDPERWKQVKVLCQSALEIERDKREAYLEEACAGDESLRKEVEALLAHHTEAEGFMKDPAMDVAAKELARDPGARSKADLAGQKVAHYQIAAKIGEGGMGVVYRARDTRLARDVAIKVLPESFSGDRDRVVRFEREARLLATLNHPNIGSVYGLEEAESRSHLVLELVEGRTLGERLKKGRIRLEEALEVCRQISAGLEAAHERGIIHRDLKPSNIKLTPEGKVKILDFGLAKVLDKQGIGDWGLGIGVSNSATITEEMTRPGLVLGTAAYMSPEQAKGKTVDKRADIWAFGCILYECLTGRQPFRGETVTETLAAVFSAEPDWNALPQDIPGRIGDLIRRCLQKDPDRRLHDIADARIEIEDIQGRHLAPIPGTGKPGRRRVFTAGIAAMALVAAVTWFWINRLRQTPPDVPMTVKPLVTYPGGVGEPTFSPEGGRIAFSWPGEKEENLDIYVRLIGPGEPQRLTTDPAQDFSPAWSPDGKFIAFLRDLKSGIGVFIVPALGGPERCLTKIELSISASNLSWSPDNKWLVATDQNAVRQPYGLHLISVETGEKRSLTSPPRTSEQCGDAGASFSSDGRSLAFVRSLSQGNGDVYRISLTDDYQPKGGPERLTFENRDIVSPVWTRDGSQILYSSGALWSSGRVVRRIMLSEPKGSAGYRTVQESFGEDAGRLAISPAGRRLAYSRGYSESNIYRIELRDKNGQVGAPQKFIASTRRDDIPEYSPDGKMIAFTSARSGSMEIWVCNADGSKPRQLTSIGGPDVGNSRWSPDGKLLVFDSRREGSSDLYLINADGGPLRRLTSDPGIEMEARWSRDGKWIYFWSDRSGRHEVYKMPAGGGEAVRITRNGGYCTFESPDGKWLYYAKGPDYYASSIWRLPVDGGAESQIHEGPVSYAYNFVVADDGIYFTKNAKTGGELEFIDLKSWKTRTICKVDKGWSYGLTISPDRRWILCSLEEGGFSDLMLVENFR